LLWSNQLTGECDLRLGSPFSGAFCLAFRPSEIPAFLTPVTRPGTLQIGGLASLATGQREPSGHQSPGLDVIQDSDFPWEITVRFFAAAQSFAFFCLLRSSGVLRSNPISSHPQAPT
jgi:hypothetical protein